MLIVADPNLIGEDGHRLSYALAIANGLPCEVTILANKAFTAGSVDPRIVPTFRRRSVDGSLGEKVVKRALLGSFDAVAPLAAVALPALRLAKKKLGPVFRDQSVLQDLAIHMKSRPSAARPRALFLASPSTADAIDILKYAVRNWDRSLSISLLLLHDPDEDRPTAAALAAILAHLQSDLQRRLLILADTPQLATAWSEALAWPVREVPVPNFVATEQRNREPGPMRVTFLGDGREEKGYHFLPTIVDGAAELLAAGLLRFVIQATPGQRIDRAGHDAITATLRRHPIEWVELVVGSLPRTQYDDLLLRAGAILAPFDPASYRRRSSSIVSEAMAVGIPAIVPAGTWMAGVVADHGGVIYDDITGVPAALEHLCTDYSRLSAMAKDRATLRRELGGHAVFVRSLFRDGVL